MNGLRIGSSGLLSTLFTRSAPLVGRRVFLHSSDFSAAALVPKIRPQLSRPPCFPRSLHITPPRQAYWFLLTPLARLTVAISARIGRRWWKRQPTEWRKGVWARMSSRKRHILGGAVACSLGGVVYYWAHLEATPITQRRRFVMFTREQVASLIEQEKDMFSSMISEGVQELTPEHEVYQRMASIALQIINLNKLTDIRGITWTIRVIDDPRIVNAVCLPTGDIFVFTGLLKACKNEEEVAMIMSHEIAHAVLGHGLEVLSSRAVVDVFSLFLVGLIWSLIPFDILATLLHICSRKTANILIHFPYSRKLETEADEVGLTLAARACYNPATAIKVWLHLSDTAVPMGNTSTDGAPQGNSSTDGAPQGNSSTDGAPQGNTSTDGAPQGNTSTDGAPQGNTTHDDVDESALEFYSTHPSNIHRYENLVQLLPKAELEYQDNGCAHKMGTFMSQYSRLLNHIKP